MTDILIFLLKNFEDVFLINKSLGALHWMRAYDVQLTFRRPTSLDFPKFGRRFQASEWDISFLIVGEL